MPDGTNPVSVSRFLNASPRRWRDVAGSPGRRPALLEPGLTHASTPLLTAIAAPDRVVIGPIPGGVLVAELEDLALGGEVILGALDGRLPGLELEAAPLSPEASRFLGQRDGNRPYRTQNGIAFIPIIGSLANRGAYIGASSGVTSYEGIGAQIRMAADGVAVHSIVLDIDGSSGEATGMFWLANLVRQVRQSKRVVAYIDDMAASAAYGTASQALAIVISPSSIVGSIGIVLTHVDHSAEMKKAGRKVTLIHARAHKVDGHPFGPLSDQIREDLQTEVAGFYSQFLETVSTGQPRLTKDTPAPGAFVPGSAALAAALTGVLTAGAADPTGVLTAFAAAGAPSFTQAQIDAARTEGKTAGATAERERIAGILGSDEGKANPAAALELALDADFVGLPAASIAKVLKAVGPAKVPAAGATTAAAPASPEQCQAENPLGLMNPVAFGLVLGKHRGAAPPSPPTHRSSRRTTSAVVVERGRGSEHPSWRSATAGATGREALPSVLPSHPHRSPADHGCAWRATHEATTAHPTCLPPWP